MSDTPHDPFEEVIELAESAMLGSLDDAQHARLEHLLTTDPTAAQAMLVYLKQAGMMRTVFGEQQRFATRIGDANREEYLELLKGLRPTEHVEPVHLLNLDKPRAAWWVRFPAAASAIAAVLVLSVALSLVLRHSPVQDPSLAIKPSTPPPAVIDTPKPTIVATLTATQNAIWSQAEGNSKLGSTLRTGDALAAGQRLNLTHGFAEITTKRGAVAILEAPATIELINNDNVLHLHAGRMVGICETDSSKGFTVRTAAMDVTDIGTRFGVATDPATGTFVDVFEGEVKVAAQDNAKTTYVLKRGESAAIGEAGRIVLRKADGVSAFDRLAMLDSGIVQASETITLIPTRPDHLDRSQYVSNSQAFVFEELRGTALPGDVNVSVTEPGRYDRFLPSELPTRVIPAGTVVRSYIIRACSDGVGRMFQGKLAFDGQILGVMTSRDQWQSFVKMTTGQSIDLKDEQGADQLLEGVGSGFTGGDDSNADWMELDESRTTLAFGFYIDQQTDHVRVFVAVPQAASE